MFERILILIVVATVLGLAYWGWRRYSNWRVSRLRGSDVPHELAVRVDVERTNLLYFTTADCAQCRLQQTPILSQLASRVDVAIHKLDAVEQEALARFYGIMTVPTTVVLDPQLRPVAINHGVAPLAKLQSQLAVVRGEQ
jgi:thioredoxin 1